MATPKLSGALGALTVVAMTALVACSLDQNGLMDPMPGRPSPLGDRVDAAADARDDRADSPDPEADGAPPEDRDAAPKPPALDAAADGTTPTACDLDGDGHRAIACGGDDCCDLDADAYPRITSAWFARATRCGTYDFDCDGRATSRYVEAACTGGGFACAGEGFMGIVPCGVDGLWQTCFWNGPGRCEPNLATAVTRSQECR